MQYWVHVRMCIIGYMFRDVCYGLPRLLHLR
nr:MAG TPA: hypothetical protein [Caudoviricetes sp.]